MRHVTGHHPLVDRDVIETMDRVALIESSGDQRLTAAEVPYDEILALLRPADELLIGHHWPVLSGRAVERVIVLPLLRVVLESLVGDAAVRLVPRPVHSREIAKAGVPATPL